MSSPKKYYKPKIKRIDLNADQAILQACKVGGNYFSGTNICQLNGGLPTGCAIYGRGQTAHTWGMGGGVSTDTQPS